MHAAFSAIAVLVFSVLTAIFFLQSSGPTPTKVLNATYDYIIVGAGSAGAVLATRLSEDPGTSVLVLEAGGTGEDNWFINTPLLLALVQRSNVDWNYLTEPQKHAAFGMKEQKSVWPRGKVLGGTSCLNAMVYARGSRHDYDSWAADGCEGWSYKDVLPYFLKSEDIQMDELKTSAFHSKGGELTVSNTAFSALPDVFLKAGVEMGFKDDDCNGQSILGFCSMQSTIKDGRRVSTYSGFLKPAMSRKNLHVSVNSLVTKVLIHDQSAEGVEVDREGDKLTVRARKEVILSGGSINSPQLLMLSGIGPKDHLKDIGIDVKADLPVGENLQDHLMALIQIMTNSSLPVQEKDILSFRAIIKYLLFHEGIFATPVLEALAFLYGDDAVTSDNGTPPDIQFHLVGSHAFSDGQKEYENFNLDDKTLDKLYSTPKDALSFAVLTVLLHPKSKGTIRLKSKDPFEYPAIDPRYLEHPYDLDTFVKGVRLVEKMIDTKAMREIGASFDPPAHMATLCTEHEYRSDSFWRCYLQHLAVTVFHPTSTCMMGAADDNSAVVDPQLRVRGIKNLRVVDASVMRDLPSSNTNAPVIMIAEKAADMIRGVETVQKWKEQIRGHV